jgi:DNA-directed RNA polymerase subunit RPC12/RpoP
MTCSCPKCTAKIEFDSAVIPSEGSFNKCSECGTNFVIRKESFARRALHKNDEISCSECGSHPGSSIYCMNCHAIYPDFLIIETSSAAKRGFGKILASLNLLRNLKIGGSAKPSYESYDTSLARPGKNKSIIPVPSGPAQLAVVLIVLILLPLGGGYYWYQDRLATKYTENYVRALLGVKMARDFEIRISDRLSADMKKGASSSLTAAEQKSAALAKGNADLLMKRIDNVPDKFTASDDSLKRLYDTYSLLHTTVTSTTGSADIYSGSVKKIDDDFRKSARELKAGLPVRISAQLGESSKKFKTLQEL